VDEKSLARGRRARRDAGSVDAKTASCSGCGERFPFRDLIELHEDNHDNLTYFHGDRLCRECADVAGVIR
jgi:hypothetical protein